MRRPFGRFPNNRRELNTHNNIIFLTSEKRTARCSSSPGMPWKKHLYRTWRPFQIRNSLQNGLTLSDGKKISMPDSFFEYQLFFFLFLFTTAIVSDESKPDPSWDSLLTRFWIFHCTANTFYVRKIWNCSVFFFKYILSLSRSQFGHFAWIIAVEFC